MEDEAYAVVDGLRRREGLMATLVRDDPDAGTDCTLTEPVCWPEQAPSDPAGNAGMAEPRGGVVQGCYYCQIRAEIQEGGQSRPLEAVCWNCLAQHAEAELVWRCCRHSVATERLSIGIPSFAHGAGFTV